MNKEQIYILEQQKKIHGMVVNRFKEFYLTGGTALAFYFGHRFSEDLDFFTQRYEHRLADEVMDFIKKELGFSYELKVQSDGGKFVKMKAFILKLKKNYPLKIDFVQDGFSNLEAPKKGMHEVEDIYYRKVSIGLGFQGKKDIVGRDIPGGRQKAKDIFDLYYLSKKHKPLNQFASEHFSPEEQERFCVWYRRFDRLSLKIELQDLMTKEDISDVIPHLDKEILKKMSANLS